tara:strand:+ start:299 stop:526 length:228 start_codon:yes stop_codon:yes gene_type:complete
MSDIKLNNLLEELKRILHVDEVDPDVPIGQLGIDSLNVIELILACQQVYEDFVDFEDIDINEDTTIRGIDAVMAS